MVGALVCARLPVEGPGVATAASAAGVVVALALLGVSVYFSIVRPLWRSRGVAAATKREDDLTDLQRTEDGEIDFSQFR